MPHIHTAPGQHDHTASAFIIRTDTPEPTLMLHKHKKTGKYMQFGGHTELDETPWQAIKHELLEESGYTMQELALLQPKDRLTMLSDSVLHPYPACHSTHPIGDDHFHTDIGYAFTALTSPKAGIADGESSDWKLVTRQELAQMSNEETLANIREIGLFIIDVCLPNWEAVRPTDFQS